MKPEVVKLTKRLAATTVRTTLEGEILLKATGVYSDENPYELAREVIAQMAAIVDEREQAIKHKTAEANSDAGLIERITLRATSNYGERVDRDRLRKALVCAHREKPIRLADLLTTCGADFFLDVFMGIYRHYDENADSMNGWTAQHAEPK